MININYLYLCDMWLFVDDARQFIMLTRVPRWKIHLQIDLLVVFDLLISLSWREKNCSNNGNGQISADCGQNTIAFVLERIQRLTWYDVWGRGPWCCAWKAGDRGFEPHSGLQVSKKQNVSSPLTRKDSILWGALRARPQGSNFEFSAL